MNQTKIVSGMRPTGRLHLGNYFGALVNWIRLQESHACYFFVADWHALTTGYEDVTEIPSLIEDLVTDWLVAGLDPEKCCIFRQSDVRQHAEMHLALSLITPLSWLYRCPTYKDQMEELEGKDITTYGFLGYPCLMAADILLYGADAVPVGADQLPHLEITREIARRFNHLFRRDLLKEPEPILNEARLLPGTDGRKMSKSYGNEIALSDSLEVIREKVMRMVTDPARIRRDDPGHPEICSVYAMHRILSPAEETTEIAAMCKAGRIGCVACKRKLSGVLTEVMAPMAEKRRAIQARSGYVAGVLKAGCASAAAKAEEMMSEVRNLMGLRLPGGRG